MAAVVFVAAGTVQNFSSGLSLTTLAGARQVITGGPVDLSIGQFVPLRGGAPADPAVPADAVTASGSGLDPQISPAYADRQVARVARVRTVPADRVRQLVRDNTVGRSLGFLGEPGVNVLELNLDLDRAAPIAP